MSTRRSRASTLRRRARRRRERRRRLRVAAITGCAALAVSGVLLVIGLMTAPSRDAVCAGTAQAAASAEVGAWRGEQLENAAVIVRTAQQLGFGRDGQIIGVMAAMGESSLRNLDHGDWETSRVTNPDGTRTSSIGLFQQQDWWGTVEERMDPATAATKFFTRLRRVADWQSLPPSHAIHRVQINTDPEHYARFTDDATAVVDALTGDCAP